MIRNNISKINYNIPHIKINPFSNWSQTMEITFDPYFSLTDLFLCVKSYTDCLIIIPIQVMIMVEDSIEKGRTFFTESISIYKLSNMSLIDFSVWYNLRWEKDAKYIGHEHFKHKILFKYSSLEYKEAYPIYPWNTEILKEILSSSQTERGEAIKILSKKIKTLEEELKKYKK